MEIQPFITRVSANPQPIVTADQNLYKPVLNREDLAQAQYIVDNLQESIYLGFSTDNGYRDRMRILYIDGIPKLKILIYSRLASRLVLHRSLDVDVEIDLLSNEMARAKLSLTLLGNTIYRVLPLASIMNFLSDDEFRDGIVKEMLSLAATTLWMR